MRSRTSRLLGSILYVYSDPGMMAMRLMHRSRFIVCQNRLLSFFWGSCWICWCPHTSKPHIQNMTHYDTQSECFSFNRLNCRIIITTMLELNHFVFYETKLEKNDIWKKDQVKKCILQFDVLWNSFFAYFWGISHFTELVWSSVFVTGRRGWDQSLTETANVSLLSTRQAMWNAICAKQSLVKGIRCGTCTRGERLVLFMQALMIDFMCDTSTIEASYS